MTADTTNATRRTEPLTIDIVSDVVCPWCYIGKRRLESALALAGTDTHSVALHWHSFQLNPDIPPEGVDRRRYLEQKFGGPQRARAIYERVEAAGREVGIRFDFARIERQPNTTDAHRLVDWAQVTDAERADDLVERLFRAYFIDGIDIGKVAELARIASDAGYLAADASAYLNSDAGRADVAAADARSKAAGIGGVPFFIFNRKLAVSGAQPPEVLREAIGQA